MTTEAQPTGPTIVGVEEIADDDLREQLDAIDREESDQEQVPQGVDPLQLASMLCVNANNFLAGRDKPPVEKQIALAQAIATIELAQATRAAYQLNLQMAQLAVNERNAAVARAAGPSGIVVPSMVPGR